MKDSTKPESGPKKISSTGAALNAKSLIWREAVLHGAACDDALNGAALRSVILITCRMYGQRIESWPSVARISRETGMSRRSIQIGISRLLKGGYLERFERPGTSNKYSLGNLWRPPICDLEGAQGGGAQESAHAQKTSQVDANSRTPSPAHISAPEAEQAESSNIEVADFLAHAEKKWGTS